MSQAASTHTMSESALLTLPSELIGMITDGLDGVERFNLTAVCRVLRAEALSSLSRSEYIYLDISKAHQRGIRISSNRCILKFPTLRTLVLSTYPTLHRKMTIALGYFGESQPDMVHCHFTPVDSSHQIWTEPEIISERLTCGTLVLSGIGEYWGRFSWPGSRCREIVQIVEQSTQYLAFGLHSVKRAGPKLFLIVKNQGGMIKSNGDDNLSLDNRLFFNMRLPHLLDNIRDLGTGQTIALACQEPRTAEEMARLESRIRRRVQGESDCLTITALDIDEESILGDALRSYERITSNDSP